MKNRHQQQGVALIITLILLSVTLIMAVAFLAISRRESGSVTTSTDTTTARLAADSALAHAEVQIIASILSTTNPYNYGLFVSTNYINANGFTNNSSNPLNVNYDLLAGGGGALDQNQFLQNVANLFYLPRAPVFVPTNSLGSNEFRYYIDLNRNGKFEDSGLITNFDNENPPVSLGSAGPQVGDPQWIGVLERPDTTHGPNNKFISRYAFIAVPADSLDLNYIHNQADDPATGVAANRLINPPSAGDDFFRNQGVGSWEINLAALLADLNTNEWSPPTSENGANDPYTYQRWENFQNVGRSFDDARALVAWRYNNNYNTLATVDGAKALFPFPAGIAAFQNNIDLYSAGPPMTTPVGINEGGRSVSVFWAGADNTNHFFNEPDDLFDQTKTTNGVSLVQINAQNYFTGRLLNAGTNTSTYDRYTFYRMLAQLGTDSSAESGRMNLNYDNLDLGSNGVLNVNGTTGAANFVPWTPIGFFTNAADRMLRLYTTNWFQANPSNYLATFYGIQTNYYYTDISGFVHTNDPTGLGLTSLPNLTNILGMTTDRIPAFGIANIPIYVNSQFVYSPAVQRILQLAANIYDASTNSFYPSVFRPIFEHDNLGNVFIANYQPVVSVVGSNDPQLASPTNVTDLPLGVSANVNVYGIPWIIGAKKGFPNFNKFTMMNVVQIERKLQVTRPSTNTPALYNQFHLSKYATNQLYIFNVSNSIGVECWNSYVSNYPNPVTVVVNDNISMMITNDSGFSQPIARFSTYPSPFLINSNLTASVSTWTGTKWDANGNPAASSFFIPMKTTAILLTNSIYYFGTTPPGVQGFFPESSDLGWETNLTSFPFAHFGLQTTNRLQVFMLDQGHVIDYVQFSGPDSSRDLNAELTGPDRNDLAGLWQTNAAAGIINQVLLSNGTLSPDSVPIEDRGAWQSPGVSGVNTVPEVQAYFNAFFSGNNVGSAPAWKATGDGSATETNLALSMQVPFTPTRTMYQFTSWQANDPLVHYITSDLNYSGTISSGLATGTTNSDGDLLLPQFPGIGSLNDRYQPWGKAHSYVGSDNNPYNFAYKDPLATNSDAWNFPTNKFPSVGWLGRVHRGTPWQTAYLKAINILDLASGVTTWTNWTGNGNPFDATNASPIQDRLLFDVFSTAPNDNATRGQLSVNQDHLAAWSAVLGGMAVPTSLTNTYTIIAPAGSGGTVNSTLGELVTNINFLRGTFTNADGLGGVFEHVGNILSVPQLTELSPFLAGQNFTNGVTDALMEWLPQQMMSLLRDSSAPRYVIYSYGQTLKPAPNGIVTSGGQDFFGMVTNYQIVAETATRAVVRVDDAKTTHPHVVIESFNLLPPD